VKVRREFSHIREHLSTMLLSHQPPEYLQISIRVV
jgi:hypothetical protein